MSRIPAHGVPSETKTRGANRSTKVAGKLKVLPEQPELPGESSREREESVGTTGDSDDGDVDEAEDEDPEDVEVRELYLSLIVLPLIICLGLQSNISHSARNSAQGCLKTH